MLNRCLLSDWFGLALTCVMVFRLAITIHDDRAQTLAERSVAYGSLGFLGMWLLVKGLYSWRADW